MIKWYGRRNNLSQKENKWHIFILFTLRTSHLQLMNFLIPSGVCLSIPYFFFSLFFSIQLSSIVGVSFSLIIIVSYEWKVMLTIEVDSNTWLKGNELGFSLWMFNWILTHSHITKTCCLCPYHTITIC